MGIGRRLKEAREKAGFTQEELGRMIGVTGSSITNYEKETSHPKEPVMYALIDALGVEPNFLFQDCVNLPLKDQSPFPEENGLSESEFRLVSLYRELNQEGQEKLLDLADDLVSSQKYIKSDSSKLGKAKGA